MSADLKKCTILDTATVRQAMETINLGGLGGVVMVNNAEGRIVGLMTDGDLRRMLLNGATLETPVTGNINPRFTWVREDTSRAYVLDLMRARSIEHIPIVNEEMRLVGIHRLGEMVSENLLPNAAVIMAGGKGMRLGELTKDVPKPMLKIAGRPILERIVIHLVGSGIRRIYIAVNYLGHVIESHFGDGRHFGCEIVYLKEDKPMGSGGALALLPEVQDHSLLVMNGDIVTDFPVQRLLRYHERGGYASTMALAPYTHQVPFGCVTLEEGAITAFREKPLLTELANAGIYAVAPRILPRVANTYFPITGLFEWCLENGEPVGGYVIEESWADIGLPQELNAARGYF
jgi:dTDP-glucose pyrophosphorylase